MLESKILKECLLKATQLGRRLFRNNTGQAWTGSGYQRLDGGKILIHDARPFRAGLCVGSSDLIGWTPITITPEMVGKTVAVFTAVECKAPKGRLTTEQAQFIKVVQQAGGIAGVARCADDVAKISTIGL